MHTQAILEHNLLNRGETRQEAPVRAAANGSAWIVALVSVAPVVLAICAWYLGGAFALIAISAMVSSTLAAALVLQNVRTKQRLADLTRFVTSLGHIGTAVDIDSFNLRNAWNTMGRTIQGAYESLLQQLRERQAALQKLEFSQSLAQAAQRRAEAIIANLTDAVIVTNTFGELVQANPEAERLLDFKAAHLLGKPVRQFLRTPALVQLIEQVTQRNGGGQRHTDELTIDSSGKPFWFKVQVGKIVDRATEPIGVITVLRDITCEKAAQARSAEFVSAVSHEIKTPLASVKAYAEMLADGDADGDSETQQKFLSIIEVQTDRMTRLLDSMLDIARIESGVVRVEKKIVSLNELVEGGSKLMAPAAAEKDLTIEHRLSSLYLPVCVDQDMMSRVVMNLISNAIKYTDRGGHITLRSQIHDDRAVFEIQDTGRGMPADALPKLFQKFYRVKENASVAPGTGLGLSLVRHIVEEVHGGTVEVESEVGKGSTFRVQLPLEQLN